MNTVERSLFQSLLLKRFFYTLKTCWKSSGQRQPSPVSPPVVVSVIVNVASARRCSRQHLCKPKFLAQGTQNSFGGEVARFYLLLFSFLGRGKRWGGRTTFPAQGSSVAGRAGPVCPRQRFAEPRFKELDVKSQIWDWLWGSLITLHDAEIRTAPWSRKLYFTAL